ncbi:MULTISPECIES: Mor transcription activator family protein [unclassified Pasteurella]|uniref:Mor transcription activator family protein n=1 Tax=unclassified Pasteurella TaxID=2621516 RepID=UPI0010739AA5|nr:hypothetical protein [Pasteurella sp. 19428wF3_WM03]TFU52000.1 hypothetical protein E4T92_04325 [Pasteurella sp. WM03]
MASKRAKDDLSAFTKSVHKAVTTATKEKLEGEALSTRIISLLYEEIGGLVIYVPRGHRVLTNARNQLIVERYNGKNVKELAHMFGLSEQWIYQILSKALEQKMQRGKKK